LNTVITHLKPTERDYGRMKKIRGDKPIGFIIHGNITMKLPV
jgi:hypothetical protein